MPDTTYSVAQPSAQLRHRHTCPHCGKDYVTVEMPVSEARALAKQAKPITETRTRTVVKLRSSKLTKRARLFLKRGVDVPPQMEADWETLKKSGMNVKDAAASLGLPYFAHGERSE